MATEPSRMRSLWSFGMTAIMLLSSPVPPVALRDNTAAPTGKLEGRIRDQAGAPIPTAQIRIDGTAFGAVADSRGYYFINNVPAGTVDLTATFVGYKRVQIKGLVIPEGKSIVQDFALEPEPLDAVTYIDSVPVSPGGRGQIFTLREGKGTTFSFLIETGIAGLVTSQAGAPIIGATIESGHTPAVVTDSSGQFLLHLEKGKRAKLKISAQGYRTLEMQVDKLKEGEVRRMTFRLKT